MIVGLIILLVACAGFITASPKERRFDFLVASGVLCLETLLATVLFILIGLVLLLSPLVLFLLGDIKHLFSLVLLIVVIDGFLLFWLNRLVFTWIPQARMSLIERSLVLSEYIIQWSLIYVTIYQVLFANILEFSSELQEVGLSFDKLAATNPEEFILLIFPSLISVWIAIVLHRHNKGE